MEKPAPPPEAVLLAVALDAVNMSGTEAATRAGISKQRLSQVLNGMSGHGMTRGRPAPRRVIAHIAAVVGVTPEQLEQAGRADAAKVLREILRREENRAQPQHARPDDLISEAGWKPPERAPYYARVIAEAPAEELDDDAKKSLLAEMARRAGIRDRRQDRPRSA